MRHEAGTGLLTYVLSFVYIGIYWNNHRLAGPDSALREAVGRDVKTRISPVLYLVGIGAAFLGRGSVVATVVAVGCYVVVAVLWLVPDRRIARVIARRGVPD